jgi:hypothetical protein
LTRLRTAPVGVAAGALRRRCLHCADVTPLIAAITLVFVFAGLAALGVMLVAALFRVTADGPGTVLARRPSQEQADDIGR